MLGVMVSAGMTFGPVLRAMLQPLFVSGLLELVKKAVEGGVDLTKEITKVKQDPKEDLVRVCFKEVVSPKAAGEMKREFIRTVLLDILFWANATKINPDPNSTYAKALPLMKGLQKKCLKTIDAKAKEILDNLAKSEPVNLLPAALREALCQSLNKGLGNFIDTVA